MSNIAHSISPLPSVVKRSGEVVSFNADKIRTAIYKSFLDPRARVADLGINVEDAVNQVTNEVVQMIRTEHHAQTIHIEKIQDMVEETLMKNEYTKVARYYVLYREEHAQQRVKEYSLETQQERTVRINEGSNVTSVISESQLLDDMQSICIGLDVDTKMLCNGVFNNIHDGISRQDLNTAIGLSVRSHMEDDPDYGFAAARFLQDELWKEAMSHLSLDASTGYAEYFPVFIDHGIAHGILDEQLRSTFDLEQIAQALNAERDRQFDYLGMQTVYDRYLTHENGVHYELPQAFFMRVAMGLALNEDEPTQRAIEFYDLISSFDYMTSTPTLFNSGTFRSQMSSCYLTTVPDDLEGIMDAYKSNAMLSKYAGGLGNDWTPVRAMGSLIKGTNGKSQGVIPFLSVNNALAVSVNQGGRRRGAVCAYLETWHLDIEDFLELRKNTGDERRRTHDMNTANWIPDLFMKRIAEEGDWTLFSPNDVPDLHDLYGQAFEQRYKEYEAMAKRGDIALHKTVSAVSLWRKMLTLLFETGHPWLTFKDPCNIRSPQQHVGVVHSSNLCTEITLNTSKDEIAVCNLGSVNLARHMVGGKLDLEKLRKTVTTAMRLLDNVIDLNFYNDDKARISNLRHRPVGLGVMGFQDALYQQGIAYASQDAVDFADRSMEAISYFAIEASHELALERGSYSTFDGSFWSQGILPIDSLEKLVEERGEAYVNVNRNMRLDWTTLRNKVKQGMRNSNCMAIAPTATISNICGVSQSIEPTYMNVFVKSNLSGEFMVVNPYLVKELKSYGLWDRVMINELKNHDGSLKPIERVPDEVKAIYATAFEVAPSYLIAAASCRQKWIDQAQSLNLYMVEPSGPKLDAMYRQAWQSGLKTTYYLRSTGATHVEKNSGDGVETVEVPKVCKILDNGCTACE